MNERRRSLNGAELLPLISEAALDKKAEDIVVLNLRQETGIADYFVVCSGDNPHHNRAIRDGIVDALSAHGVSPWHSEGEQDAMWILLDYSDVIVHVMTPKVRGYYGLEELWSKLDKSASEGRFHA